MRFGTAEKQHMKLTNFTALLIIIALSPLLVESDARGDDAGVRAAFTRSGWVGARYIAMGKAAEVVADDVFSIYWNPSGLSNMMGKASLTADRIREKAKEGDVDDINEDDLINFSEDEELETVFQIGISAAKLDLEREAGFAGMALSIFNGVIGIGLYSLQSTKIESYDESGKYLKDIDYRASIAYLSYGWSSGVLGMGFSLKGLHEKIGEYEYYGGGVDIGAQAEVIPFLKIGFMLQDLGTGLRPREKYEGIENKYDFGSPALRLSTAITSRSSDFILALSAVKKLEQEEIELNLGLQYDVAGFLSVYAGLNDKRISSGMTLRVIGLDISYAFTFDKVNNGYNNIVAVKLEI